MNKMYRGTDRLFFFSEEDIQMVNRYMKRCSTEPITREIPVKTPVRYYLIPVRMTITRNTRNDKYW